MADSASVHAVVSGHVQGVYFRAFVSSRAEDLGLAGYVRNLGDGSIEVQAEGERSRLEKLISYLNVGPPGARVEKVNAKWLEYTGSYPGFSIRY